MSKRKLLPGEQEAWDLACDDKRWVLRRIDAYGDPWAIMGTREQVLDYAYPTDKIRYVARSVRPDGTPVVP
jgi:hypothetical protein